MKNPLLALGLILTSHSYANDLLQEYCDKLGGKVVDSFTCPKSKLRLHWDFCLAESRDGKPIFFDGCTGPSGDHAALFYPACIKHDLCYHHEPLTTGLSRKDCDQQFLNSTLDSCKNAKNRKSCERWAHTMFYALRGAGFVAFNCEKSVVDYLP